MSVNVRIGNKGFAIVDDSDFVLVSRYKWFLGRSKTLYYARAKSNGRKIAMHRLIMGQTDPLIHVHHINGDTLDNRRVNLQVIGISEHAKIKRSSKRVVCARFQPHRNNWRVDAYLGTFASEFEAKAMADKLTALLREIGINSPAIS